MIQALIRALPRVKAVKRHGVLRLPLNLQEIQT